MRIGFTTGSCAAAAAKAATYMLLTGKEKKEITITTPKGIPFEAKLVDIERSEHSVTCAVIKDGGDDPDVTTGAHICATVTIPEKKTIYKEKEKCLEKVIREKSAIYKEKEKSLEKVIREKSVICEEKEKEGTNREGFEDDHIEAVDISYITKDVEIMIDGGFGVGRVTMPGLDQPVGNAAINHVPREMITKEVTEVCEVCDFHGTLEIIISVPEGEEVAKKTFNPRLGIVGGISILGTSGVVEPMSSQALLDTIRVELSQKKALGYKIAAVSPGNYGLDFMKARFGYDLDKSVKCSNFIGDTIDMAAELGFEGMLLTGHIGKLIKVSGGMMNTHSKEGDCRMELLAAAGLRAGCSAECANGILNNVTTEEGVRILQMEGCLEKAMEISMEKIQFFLNKRAAGRLQVECMMYSNDFGMLAESEDAEKMLEKLM